MLLQPLPADSCPCLKAVAAVAAHFAAVIFCDFRFNSNIMSCQTPNRQGQHPAPARLHRRRRRSQCRRQQHRCRQQHLRYDRAACEEGLRRGTPAAGRGATGVPAPPPILGIAPQQEKITRTGPGPANLTTHRKTRQSYKHEQYNIPNFFFRTASNGTRQKNLPHHVFTHPTDTTIPEHNNTENIQNFSI